MSTNSAETLKTNETNHVNMEGIAINEPFDQDKGHIKAYVVLPDEEHPEIPTDHPVLKDIRTAPSYKKRIAKEQPVRSRFNIAEQPEYIQTDLTREIPALDVRDEPRNWLGRAAARVAFGPGGLTGTGSRAHQSRSRAVDAARRRSHIENQTRKLIG